MRILSTNKHAILSQVPNKNLPSSRDNTHLNLPESMYIDDMTVLNSTITIVAVIILMGIAHALLILREGARLEKRIDDLAIRLEKRFDAVAMRLEKRFDAVAKLDSRIPKLEGVIEVGLLQSRPAKPQVSDTPTGEEVSDQPSQAVVRRTFRNPE